MTEEKSEKGPVSRRVQQIANWINDHRLYSILIVGGVILFVTMILFPDWFPPWVGIRQLDKPENVQLRKTLWDWLDLFIVSFVVALALFWLNTSQKRREGKREEEREKQEEQRQTDNQHQATLLDYYDKMSKLILEKRLCDVAANWDDTNAPEKAPVVVVARALTLSTFRNLDPDRNAAVLRFLGDAGLASKISRDNDMSSVNFTGSNLISADLENAYLCEANLCEAYLREAKLSGADLRGVNLTFADLTETALTEANLIRANLRGANLRGAYLYGASLSGADLSGAKYNSATIWPNFFNPEEGGAFLVNEEGNPIEGSDEEK